VIEPARHARVDLRCVELDDLDLKPSRRPGFLRAMRSRASRDTGGIVRRHGASNRGALANNNFNIDTMMVMSVMNVDVAAAAVGRLTLALASRAARNRAPSPKSRFNSARYLTRGRR
jgi:hypothetical protein